MSATYVTTVPQMTFNLAPASPLPSVTSLIARLLRFLAAWLFKISFAIEPVCCDNPQPKEMEQGWRWCMNCGHTWQEKAENKTGTDQAQVTRRLPARRQLYAELDRSLRQGYLAS